MIIIFKIWRAVCSVSRIHLKVLPFFSRIHRMEFVCIGMRSGVLPSLIPYGSPTIAIQITIVLLMCLNQTRSTISSMIRLTNHLCLSIQMKRTNRIILLWVIMKSIPFDSVLWGNDIHSLISCCLLSLIYDKLCCLIKKIHCFVEEINSFKI